MDLQLLNKSVQSHTEECVSDSNKYWRDNRSDDLINDFRAYGYELTEQDENYLLKASPLESIQYMEGILNDVLIPKMELIDTDGVEVEIYKDGKGNFYGVPIEIVRDFESLTLRTPIE